MEKDNLQHLRDILEASIDARVTFLEKLIRFKLEANEKALLKLAGEDQLVVDQQGADMY